MSMCVAVTPVIRLVLIEVIELAKSTKAALFVCHITHNAMGRIGDWLAMIDEANQGGRQYHHRDIVLCRRWHQHWCRCFPTSRLAGDF